MNFPTGDMVGHMSAVALVLTAVTAGLVGAWVMMKYLSTAAAKRTGSAVSRKLDLYASGEMSELMRLNVGWVAQYQHRDYVVRERIDFIEHGFRWIEVLLADLEDSFWLEIEQDDELLLTRWDDVTVDDAYAITTNQISVAGVAYSFEEAGRPSFRASGSTGLPTEGTMSYRSFTNGRSTISCDEWLVGIWECSIATPLRSFDITVMGPSDAGGSLRTGS
jgi:hypothetical protein